LTHLSRAHDNCYWHEETAAPDQPRWVVLFSTSEFWQRAFRWNKGRTLDRNPMAWLQEYSWPALENTVRTRTFVVSEKK
jgi:hypothetical protein